MFKTKIKVAFAMMAMIAMTSVQFGSAIAANIGTGSVNGTTSFDSPIVWDDALPGFATGSVSNIVVTARVDPILNMQISTGAIDLGTLVAGTPSSGTLNIEVGTNAVNGVVITARSGSGGLTHTTDNSVQINSLATDGNAESYTFSSVAGATDSGATGFSSTGDLGATEVVNNSTEHKIYETNKPEPTVGDDDVVFTVTAQSNTATTAGDYQDTVTFTIVGKF